MYEKGFYHHSFCLKDLQLFYHDDEKLGVAIVSDYYKYSLKYIFEKRDKIDFSNDHMLKLAYSTLCALNFMHSANILHRDIKPANLLISSDCNVSLCDFGYSRSQPEKKSNKPT